MTTWKKFGQKEELSESDYAKLAAGTTKIPAGHHKGVTLAGISPVDSDEYLAIDAIWENEDGLTFQQRIFLTSNVWEEGKRTDRISYSKTYIQFGLSIAGDVVLNRKFFVDLVPDNPSLLSAIVGTKANITIGLPKKGFTIKNLGDNKLVVADIETGEVQDDIGEMGDFKKLQDAAKENGLNIAFNQVLANKANNDYAADNQEQLKLAMDDAAKPVVKVASESF
jgi:hypothetical protein